MAKEQEVKLEAELKKLMQQRVELEKEVVEQKNKMDSAEKKSIENIKKLISLEAVLMDSVEKEEEVRKKIEKIEKESETRTKKSEKFQKETTDRTTKQFEKEEKISETKKKRLEVEDKSRNLANEQKQATVDIGARLGIMNDKSKKYAETLEKGKGTNSEIVDYWNKIGDSIKEGYNTSTAFTSNLDDMRSINSDVSQLYQDSVAQTGLIEKGQAKIVETDKAREALAMKRYNVENNLLGLSAADQATLMKGIKLEEQRLNTIDAQNKVIEKQNSNLQMIEGSEINLI